MNITSAVFVKGVVQEDEILEEKRGQVAFVGRSNVGKSSVINSLVAKKGLAKTSSFPGRTQEINVFLINKNFYLVDLPGYGFAKGSKQTQEQIQQLIYWYLLDSHYVQSKIVFIIDALVGFTENDSKMLYSLEEREKNIVIVANKVDKLKKSDYQKQLKTIQDAVGDYKVIPYSAEKNIGIGILTDEILKSL